MKIVFLGSTKFSEELLSALIKHNFEISPIFTIPQEFTVRGNEKVVNTNFVDSQSIAMLNNILFYYVDENNKLLSYENVINEIKPILDWYYIVPNVIRNIPKYGACEIHASLLPKYAGWAPLVWAIINREKETGVTFFQFDDSVDGGDIIFQESFSIEPEDTIKEVYDKATEKSSEILINTLSKLDKIEFKKQDKSKLEIWDKRTPIDGKIYWAEKSVNLYNFIRAQTIPYLCPFTKINNQIIKILNSKLTQLKVENNKNGKIVFIDNKALVATSDYFLEIGLIDDGNEIQQFKDYARVNNLWGGYSRAKNLRMVA